MAPIPGLAAVSLFSTLSNGQQTANTFHISKPGSGTAPTPSDLATLASDLNTFLGTQYKSILTTGSLFASIKLAQVPDPTIHDDPYSDYYLPINAAGTRSMSGSVAPNQACICLSLKTNSGQRSYRGHLLMPPGQEASELDGQIWNTGAAYYEACNAFGAKLIDGCGASPSWTGSLLPDYTLSIYSKTLQARSEPSVTGCITVVTQSTVHWLRSRARGTT